MNLALFLNWFVRCCVMVIWIIDILNIGSADILDVDYELNAAFWALVFTGIEINELVTRAKFLEDLKEEKGAKNAKK